MSEEKMRKFVEHQGYETLEAHAATICAWQAACAHKDAEFAKEREQLRALIAMQAEALRDFAVNFDCDEDAHKYGSTCRACEAKRVRAASDESVASYERELKAKALEEAAKMLGHGRTKQNISDSFAASVLIQESRKLRAQSAQKKGGE